MSPLRTASGPPHTGHGPTPTPADVPSARCAGEVAVVVLVTWRPDAIAWGLSRLVLGGWPWRDVPGLGFAKVLGSGREGGFGLAPGWQHQGLFLVFTDEATALRFSAASAQLAAYRRHAASLGVAVLRATSCRGSWSGRSIAVSASPPARGPVAVLTRASIRPRRAAAFWRLAPAAEASLSATPGCRLAVGLGEAPLLRQATFSLWDDAASMEAYAREGAHRQASRAAASQGFFSESMFVRFAPLALGGQWRGQDLGRL